MMEIKPLSREVVSKIRSTCSINSLSQCVTELVLNSLDAKSSAVAIRLNSVNFRIQVVDNGVGISQENLDKIARKYSTSKCQTLMDLERKPRSYGYKGESLWSISNVSKTLVITSKYASSENTFSKSINLGKHGKVAPAKRRQSNGTTITIDSFFHNLPVRQKRLKKEFEFEEIITFLKSMSIIHPQISITLRDDITGKLLFKRPKSENIIKSFTDLYSEIKYDDTVVIKVQKDKVTLEALLSKEFFQDNIIQHIFVNKRPVHHSKLQAFISKELAKVAKKKIQSVKALYPAYVLNIKCSISNYIIMYENSEPKVDFLNIDIIHRCIEKLILNFRGETDINEEDNKPTEKKKSVCGVSDLAGAVKGFGFKDWLEKPDTGKEESGVIEEVTEQSEFQLKKIEPMRKHKISPMKKGQLKSLPIKILEQKCNKLKNSRDCEYKEKGLEGKRYQEEKRYDKNNIIVEQLEDNIADETKMKNFCRLERNCADILAKKIPEETLFSNFTNTEEKGKDFLMYMFLKSTELFRGDTSYQPTQISEDNSDMNVNNSIETIMESNIFFQNVTKSKNHQFNENISVSVRLKRRKNSNVYQGQPNFSEIYTFSIPEKKKRKTAYFNEKSEHKSGNYLTSPYFGTKKLDPNYSSKRNIIKKPNGSSAWFGDENTNKLMYENQYDQNFTILRSCKSNQNYSKNIKPREVKNCFDQMSINTFCFLNFTKNNLVYDSNKSYVFNFENDAEFEGGLFENNRLMNGKLADNNSRRMLTFDSGKFDYNSPAEVFDFNNLPFSPIPKIKITPEKNQEDEKLHGNLNLQIPNFPEKNMRNITTWRKYISEGDYQRCRSPYFSEHKLVKKIHDYSFSLKNSDFPRNETNRENFKSVFRKYNTEPIDVSRLQYVHRTKQSIDKLFLDLKNNHLFQNDENLSSFSKEAMEVFTTDSLDQENNIERNKRSPLWKKFIKNKRKSNKMKEKFEAKFSFENNKDNNRDIRQKSHYFNRKIASTNDNLVESPDLFSDEIMNSENRTLKKPVNDLTFLPNSAISFDMEGIFDDEDKDLRTLTAIGPAQTSNLIITLNENAVNEHEMNPGILTKADVEGEIPAEDLWLKKLDHEGNEFYFNERTGMTSFVHPKKQEIYILKERPHFMPKGLSPVLIPDPKLDKSLSPISKEKLHDEILKSYSNNLGVVKWEKCIKGRDPKKFFENLYKERVNEYEKEVPNIIRTKMSKIPLQILNDNKFNKMLFKDLKVIGQIDQKFIAAIDRKTSYLILFDQHAVHERIRLEDLLKEYEGKCSKCENVTLFMKGTDLDLLRSHQKYLDGIGIHFRFLKNGITVDAVPMCFSNKITKESSLSKLIQLLIREVLDLVKDTRGVLTGLPKMISQIINMEACRGSVKFGEFLNEEKMERLMEQISECTLPFQCAHGRPTMIPLLSLGNEYEANV